MKLTAADRNVVSIIGQAFPPSPIGDPPLAMEWEPVIARAERQMLTPLLFDSLKKTGRIAEISAPLLLEIRSAYLRSANQSEENFRELAALLNVFTKAQIPVILLKGSALAVSVYERIAQRPMGDLDFLIHKDALPQVLIILKDRGYIGYRNLGRGFEQEFRSQLCLVRPDASRLTIEPHWHLFDSPAEAEKIPIEWFWAHTEPIVVRGRHAQMLAPAAALLHLSGHYYLHHQGFGLRMLYDIARLLTHWSERIDWDDLLRTAESMDLLWAVEGAVREAAEIWRVTLPDYFSRKPESAGGMHAAAAAVPSRYLHHWDDVMSIAGLKPRLMYMGKLLFPDKVYLRDRYGMQDDRLAVLYYGLRIVRCVARIPGLLLAFMRRRVVWSKGRDTGR